MDDVACLRPRVTQHIYSKAYFGFQKCQGNRWKPKSEPNPKNLRNVVEWIADCYRDSDDDMGFEYSTERLQE